MDPGEEYGVRYDAEPGDEFDERGERTAQVRYDLEPGETPTKRRFRKERIEDYY